MNMTIWRIEYNLADQSAIANDPNSYLWDNDPVPLAAWLSSKGLNKVNFDNEIQYYRRKTPEFLQMLAAVRDNLPNG